MIPTIPWMKEKFTEYNKKYFGGRLPEPKFSVQPLADEWGNYKAQAQFNMLTRKIVNVTGPGTLCLTNSFSRKEEAVISTLLHEMCHMYVYLVMGIYPNDIHGREFLSIANKINGQGHNIRKELPISDDDIEGGTNETDGCILIAAQFPERQDFKWWVCKAEADNYQAFVEAMRKLPGAAQEIGVYKSPSKELFHFKSDPKTLVGWGGQSKYEVAQNIAQFCGDNNPKNFLIDGPNMYKFTPTTQPTNRKQVKQQQPQQQPQPNQTNEEKLNRIIKKCVNEVINKYL